jgi:hypothetical protein
VRTLNTSPNACGLARDVETDSGPATTTHLPLREIQENTQNGLRFHPLSHRRRRARAPMPHAGVKPRR